MSNSIKVVLLYSGGIDSLVSWDILLANKFIKKVYPLQFAAGNLPQPNNIVDYNAYWQNFFYKKYGDKVEPITRLSFSPYPLEIAKFWSQKHQFSSDALIDFYHCDTGKIAFTYGNLLSDFIYLSAAGYCRHLWALKGIKINKIVTGNLLADGETIHGQSKHHRDLISQVINDLPEYKPLKLESAFDNLGWTKAQVIEYAITHKLDLSKTWSCNVSPDKPCGSCNSCLNRSVNLKKFDIVEKNQNNSLFLSMYKCISSIKLNWGIKRKLRQLRSRSFHYS